jgi:hypothetical protein
MNPKDLVDFWTNFGDLIKWVGGPVGSVGSAVFAFWKWYQSRSSVSVRDFDLGSPNLRFVAFKATNISDKTTSFEPRFTLTGYTPKRERQSYTYSIEGGDRQLPPHAEKNFSAAHSDSANKDVAFLWYMKARINLAGGKHLTKRYLNGSFKELGYWQYAFGLLRFKLLRSERGVPEFSLNTRLAVQADEIAKQVEAVEPTLIAGVPEHPPIQLMDHRAPVIQIKLVNEALNAKAYVNMVNVYDIHKVPVPASWSDVIDEFGNTAPCGNLVLVEHEKMLYIRHEHGLPLNYAFVVIHHNMPGSPLYVKHDDFHVGTVATPW